MSSLCFFFLFLSTLSSTSSRSRSRLWQRCHLTTAVVVVLGLVFPSAVAGSVQNVSTTELIISPTSAWQIADDSFLATNIPGASVTYECSQPCTGIEFILIQPANEQGQITACLDCVDAPSNARSNSTNYVLVNTQSLISYQGLSSELHTLQITTHSTTTLFVGSVEVNLPSDDNDSSPPPSDSSDSSDSNPNPTSASGINTASAERNSHSTTTSSSSSKSTDGSGGEKLSSSSSSSKIPIIPIAAGVGAAVLALLAAILICLYRRRKQRRSRAGPGGGGGNQRSRWQKVVSGGGDGSLSDEEQLQKGYGRPSSPMLETFRSSRDLEADYGYGYIPTESKSLGGGGFGGVPRSAVPFASISGGASRASLDDDDMDRGSYNINNSVPPVRGLGPIAEDGERPQIKKSLNRRTSIPSIYSAYSDPWQTVEDDYYYNSDAEDDPSDPNAKAERLKANLNLNTNTAGGGRRNTTATTRNRRDTTVSVKDMLNNLNDAIRTGADTFAWKPSAAASPRGGGGGNPPPVPAVPMRFLSPNSATVGRKQTKGQGHKPSRSTDVLI